MTISFFRWVFFGQPTVNEALAPLRKVKKDLEHVDAFQTKEISCNNKRIETLNRRNATAKLEKDRANDLLIKINDSGWLKK